jgi:hypothetical protein
MLMNMDKKLEIIELCSAMIGGSVDLIEGCRRLVSLRHQVKETDNEIFFAVRAVDSETDHFPVGAMREQCSEDFLRKSDKEIAEYLEDATPSIISSCEEIINYFQK